MSRNALLATIAVCLAAVLCTAIYTLGHRYSIVSISPGGAYRMDRISGRTHWLRGGRTNIVRFNDISVYDEQRADEALRRLRRAYPEEQSSDNVVVWDDTLHRLTPLDSTESE